MPYTKAHYYLLSILPITVIAFWPNYFSKLAEAPTAHHLHGITATAWILFMSAQSFLIHRGSAATHKKMGLITFILVPSMTGAFALVSLHEALGSVERSPFFEQFGRALLTIDILLLFATPLFVYLAFKLRKQVKLHSALMFATIVGLLPPILTRLFAGFMPGMTIRGLDSLYRFEYCLQLSMFVTIVLALFLYFKYKPDGWPWLLAAIVSLVSFVLYATLGQSEIWSSMINSFAEYNSIGVYLFGFVLGLVACVLGWVQGKVSQARVQPA